METTTREPPRTIDVTGLPEDAVRAVESLVNSLREPGNADLTKAPYDEWVAAFRAWTESHKPSTDAVDWSRESIYAGRGE